MSKARTKAAEQYAKLMAQNEKTKRADKKIIQDKEDAHKERAAKGARLKALRLAKEAADRETAEAKEGTDAAAPKPARLPDVHRRQI